VFAGWYLFTIVTYGTNVPAGLFLPGMIIGCALGQVYAEFVSAIGLIDPSELDTSRKVFVVLGVGAVMAGYTRLTYTLAIIVMETSQVISLFIPTAFTILVSNVVGYWFTRSLYERAVRSKQMPILIETVPESQKYVIADQIMSTHCVTLKSVDTVSNVYDALKTGHHAFPVMNKNNNVSGVIPKNFIIVLLVKQAFYKMQKTKSMAPGLNTSKVTDEDEDGIRTERVDTNVQDESDDLKENLVAGRQENRTSS
jgi:CBS domain-containing protein